MMVYAFGFFCEDVFLCFRFLKEILVGLADLGSQIVSLQVALLIRSPASQSFKP